MPFWPAKESESGDDMFDFPVKLPAKVRFKTPVLTRQYFFCSTKQCFDPPTVQGCSCVLCAGVLLCVYKQGLFVYIKKMKQAHLDDPLITYIDIWITCGDVLHICSCCAFFMHVAGIVQDAGLSQTCNLYD